jgi:DNA modification methylase
MSKAKNAAPIFVDALTERLKVKSRSRRADLKRLAAVAAPSRIARNDILPKLEIVELPIEELRSAARKVRKCDPAHVREVAESIRAFGFCAPILIGVDNVVIDGEIRLEAGRMLGIATVPCVRMGHLSRAEQHVLRLAANRLGEKGEWDIDALKFEFEELILWDAPIEIAGFSLDVIDQILIGEESVAFEEGQLAPTAGAAPVARIGDVFHLGSQRLLCGDSCDPAVLRKLMEGDGPARLILTDVPYNVKIGGNVSERHHREFVMASGEMSDDQFLAFNAAWTEAVLPHLCEGGLFGTFIDWRGSAIIHTAALQNSLKQLNLIVWVKGNPGKGGFYRSQHELFQLYKKGDAQHVNNIHLGKKGRNRSNVWNYPGASSLGSDTRRDLEDHPTVKPTAMLEDALLDMTHRGDIVIDPFLGSGSTLIAAEKAGRICRGVELDPLYVDVSIRRFQAVTGRAAVLVETGETFDVLAVRRAAHVDFRPSVSVQPMIAPSAFEASTDDNTVEATASARAPSSS